MIDDLVQRHGAKDATARKSAMAELKAAGKYSSQYSPDMQPIPEKSWAYRFAKKFAYHEYGVYTEHFKPEQWQDPSQQPPPPEESELVQISG